MVDNELAVFQTILVPLDGSTRAECALPVAERLARTLGSSLLLTRISESSSHVSDLPSEIVLWQAYHELRDIEDEAAHDYLAHVADGVRSRGVERVSTRAVRGQPAATLLALLSSGRIDLVVMASHGYGGVQRALFGSVADRLIHRAGVPILVVHAVGDEQRYLSLARALVPLDGSGTADAALEMVRLLAGSLLRHITLARVVNPELPASEHAAAQSYLAATHAAVSAAVSEHDCVVDDVLLVGGETEQILEQSRKNYDLIILSTHGRSGPQRWLLGSVAESVAHGARVPTLLLPAPKELTPQRDTTR
jgi:nucleotide-binding universal stress UspA family protein